MNNLIKTETATTYAVALTDDDKIIERAIQILKERLQSRTLDHEPFTQPADIRRYLQLQIAEYPSEVFGVLLLNNKHVLIADEILFYGTIDAASVYPREVVRKVIEHNAAAVVFYHNHPSGDTGPSDADKNITEKLKKALSTIDVRTLDHFIVGEDVYSFAEHGYI